MKKYFITFTISFIFLHSAFAQTVTTPSNVSITTDGYNKVKVESIGGKNALDVNVLQSAGSGTTPVSVLSMPTLSVHPDLSVTESPLSGATISANATGDNTVISGTALQTVRIFRMMITADSITSLIFKDGAGTNLTGAVNLSANGSVVLDYTSTPWFVTSAGNGFIINQSGTAIIGGRVWYVKN